ncbi:hypothetical protein KAR91_80070 [Candidatus Pacearchaeota archaeon]|nr:hypothetical protein [Candidatus Pacearchaeota archaeon]
MIKIDLNELSTERLTAIGVFILCAISLFTPHAPLIFGGCITVGFFYMLF